MKTRHLIAIAVGLMAVTSKAQLAESVFAQVTDHSFFDSWVGTIPSVSILDVVDGSNRMAYQMQVLGSYDTDLDGHQYFSVTETFTGYVRVKWIGPGTPDPTIAYEGKFHVWGLRRIHASIAFLHSLPAREMITDTGATGVHVEIPNQVHIFHSTPPNTPRTVFGLIGTELESETLGAPLPTVEDPGIWTYLGQVVTGGVFKESKDGNWYADMDLGDGTIHTSDWHGTGNFAPADGLTTNTISRVTFELFEVGGEPIVVG